MRKGVTAPKLRVATLRLHGVTQIQRLRRWCMHLPNIYTYLRRYTA
ncbi:MAG: hypothetical protein LBM61_03100 [Prevotellaceae bacterium]|nr:hypothetical protein [Prevotellaceae bacterium]